MNVLLVTVLLINVWPWLLLVSAFIPPPPPFESPIRFWHLQEEPVYYPIQEIITRPSYPPENTCRPCKPCYCPPPPPPLTSDCNNHRPSPRPPKTVCRPREIYLNTWNFVCDILDMEDVTIRREDILWLKNKARNETINVIIPNYKLEEVIKTAFKKEQGGNTNVNILLKRPTISVATKIDETQPKRQEPNVNLQYETPTPRREIVHYNVGGAGAGGSSSGDKKQIFPRETETFADRNKLELPTE